MSPDFKDFLKALACGTALLLAIMWSLPSKAACQIPPENYRVVSIIADGNYEVWYHASDGILIVTQNGCVEYKIKGVQAVEPENAFRFYRDTR